MLPIYEEVLQKIGLDEKEAKVYLAALKLRSAHASDIAKEAGIERSTCYGLLEELVRKGLIGKAEISKVLHFIAETPETLKTYLEGQKSNLELASKDIQAILPNLKHLQKEAFFKPKVEYFEGEKGLAAAFENVLPDIKKMAKTNIPLLINGSSALILEIWPGYAAYARKRIKTGISIKKLSWEKKIPMELAEVEAKYTIKYLPKKYAYPAGMNILEDKILLIDRENLFVAIIQNERLAQTMRIFFEFMWEHSK